MKKINYLYLIKEDSKDDLYKVGISTNPFKRITGVRNGSARGAYIYACFYVGNRDDAQNLEKKLHQQLKSRRKSGEWFNINDLEARAIINQISTKIPHKIIPPKPKKSIDFQLASKELFNKPIKKVVHIKDQRTDSKLVEEAKKALKREERASTSLLQTKLSIGYARARRIMDILKEEGVVGRYYNNVSKGHAILQKL